MIEIKKKQILINGKPELLLVGEIHYFRLPKTEWQHRIDLLKETGCNAVASYVPWIVHEEVEGEFDFTGKTRDETDLAYFIDLCNQNGLYFFLRPGPFIMAEVKNEGLPYWLMEKYPHIVPTTWEGRKTPNRTIDYLHPDYLLEVDEWYREIMDVCKPRLHANGGNIIAIQLDNEIGMLTWVSNSPDLTDFVVEDFSTWLKDRYGKDLLARYPFSFDDLKTVKDHLLKPEEAYALSYRWDYGTYSRDRYRRYVDFLKQTLEKYGSKDVLYVVNIHGTGGGRGLTFPIGISQLYETYQEKDVISGSDIYFGDLDMSTFHDLYLINGFMDSVHTKDHPLTSVEFNCGDGNFGDNLGSRIDPSASDFKMRMCIAQNTRLINYYLFTGGYNYRLKVKPNDGNDRIAFTGERHGFAAPVNPEGTLSYTFPRTRDSIQLMMGNKEKLASMYEEYDNVVFGFIPDYFMTEYHYPKSEKMRKVVENLQANRSSGAWNILGKALLLLNYRFTSVDLQNKPLNPKDHGVLVTPSALYMAKHVQEKIVNFLNKGGNVVLYGELPLYDLEGNPCTLLVDALNVQVQEKVHSEAYYYLSLVFNTGKREIRTHFAQPTVSTTYKPLIKVYGTDAVCGFETMVGKGKVLSINTEIDCDLPFLQGLFNKVGMTKRLSHDNVYHGLFMTLQKNEKDEKFLHILNLDGLDKEATISYDQTPLFDGKKLLIQSKDGLMLPMDMDFKDFHIHYSTAEIRSYDATQLTLRLTQKQDVIKLSTKKQIKLSPDIRVEKNGNDYTITSLKHAKVDNTLTIIFE